MQKWFPSATCLPPATYNTLHLPQRPCKWESWSFSCINSVLGPPLNAVCKSQMMVQSCYYSTLCPCSWVFWTYFVGMKNPLVITTAWLSSSGLFHVTGVHEDSPAAGCVDGFYLAAVCSPCLCCFLCQGYALILFPQPRDFSFSHQEATLSCSIFPLNNEY